jgi:hypothetical protein
VLKFFVLLVAAGTARRGVVLIVTGREQVRHISGCFKAGLALTSLTWIGPFLLFSEVVVLGLHG